MNLDRNTVEWVIGVINGAADASKRLAARARRSKREAATLRHELSEIAFREIVGVLREALAEWEGGE